MSVLVAYAPLYDNKKVKDALWGKPEGLMKEDGEILTPLGMQWSR